MQNLSRKPPELKDLEEALKECEDETSCRNVWVEYTKRGGQSHGDSGPMAVRRRIDEINAAEHIKQERLIPAKPEGAGGISQRDAAEAPSGAIEPIVESRAPIMPVSTGKALKAAFDAWHRTADELIDRKTDVSNIHGKEYLNIAFWRKIAVAYGIEAWPKKRTERLRDGVLVCEVEMTVRAPGGRACQSFGIASKAEPKLKDATDHDLMARAWSRAYVRGMRDLIGFGSPSAEEVEE